MSVSTHPLQTLINQLCPNGVEFQELGEVCDFKYGQGNTIPTIGGDYPVYGCNGVVGSHNEFNNEDSAIIGHIGTAGIVVWANGKHFVTYNGTICKPINKDLLSKYVYYNLLTLNLTSLTKGSQPFLSYGTIKKLKIPLLPLPIQQEIVRILDSFTQLEAELEAELEARKKQYEYYRDQLLSTEKDVEWKTLGEVILPTKNIKWKENQNIEFKYIDLSSVNRENNQIEMTQTISHSNAPSRAQQIVIKDDVIFGTTRPTLKRYSIIKSEYNKQICSTGFMILRANQNLILPSYLFFTLTTEKFLSYIENNQEGASYPAITNNKVKQFAFPIPPLAEQEQIVAILDKFDALVNDISIGLPAEIKARRQQYEYYRNQLLSFTEYGSK